MDLRPCSATPPRAQARGMTTKLPAENASAAAPFNADGIAILDSDECWALLGSTEVGRLAVSIANHPDVFPINYVVDHKTIVFRTAEGTKLAAAVLGTAVAFEIDGYDAETRRGVERGHQGVGGRDREDVRPVRRTRPPAVPVERGAQASIRQGLAGGDDRPPLHGDRQRLVASAAHRSGLVRTGRVMTMNCQPVATLDDRINDIRMRTAEIVNEEILPQRGARCGPARTADDTWSRPDGGARAAG